MSYISLHSMGGTLNWESGDLSSRPASASVKLTFAFHLWISLNSSVEAERWLYSYAVTSPIKQKHQLLYILGSYVVATIYVVRRRMGCSLVCHLWCRNGIKDRRSFSLKVLWAWLWDSLGSPCLGWAPFEYRIESRSVWHGKMSLLYDSAQDLGKLYSNFCQLKVRWAAYVTLKNFKNKADGVFFS